MTVSFVTFGKSNLLFASIYAATCRDSGLSFKMITYANAKNSVVAFQTFIQDFDNKEKLQEPTDSATRDPTVRGRDQAVEFKTRCIAASTSEHISKMRSTAAVQKELLQMMSNKA